MHRKLPEKENIQERTEDDSGEEAWRGRGTQKEGRALRAGQGFQARGSRMI